jgi:inosine triphosphate pyrophosphatase
LIEYQVFVTGNHNKLKEVRAILETMDIHVEARELDSKPTYSAEKDSFNVYLLVPEIQGTTIQVSAAKCRQAAKLV